MPPRFTRVLLLALLCIPILTVRGQDFEIRLNRPHTVGERFRTNTVSKEVQQMSMTANGRVVRSERNEVSVDFDGVIEVLAVGPTGKALSISATVDRLVKSEDGKENSLASKGDVILVSLDGRKQEFKINGNAVGKGDAKALSLVFSLSKSAVTDDDIFGTKEKKKVGQTWSVNTAVAEKDLTDSFDLKVEGLSGEVKLDELLQQPDGDALKISGSMKMKPIPPMPPTFVVDRSDAEAQFETELPLNPTKQRPVDRMAMRLNVVSHGETPNGEKIILNVRSERATQEKRTPMK